MKNPLLQDKGTAPEVQDVYAVTVYQVVPLTQALHTAKPSELALSKKYPVLHLVAVEGDEAVVTY